MWLGLEMWYGEEFGEQRCRGHIHRERLNHIPSNKRSRGGGLNGRGASRARAEGVLEGGFGRTELGDVLLKFGTLAAVFDEEASIPLVGNLHLLDHSIMFSFEGCDLARESWQWRWLEPWIVRRGQSSSLRGGTPSVGVGW